MHKLVKCQFDKVTLAATSLVCVSGCQTHKCRLTWNVAARSSCSSALLGQLFHQSVVLWSSCFQAFPHPHPFRFFFPSTDLISVDRCLELGLIAHLQGFASYSILSGDSVDTGEAPDYPRHPPSISVKQQLIKVHVL